MKDADKNVVLGFIRAFEAGDISAIERQLDPNFHDWRKSHGELARFEFLRMLEVFFAGRERCVVEVANIVSEGAAVAVEMTMHMDVDGRRVELTQHDLFLLEGGKIVAIHEYGDDFA